MIGDMRLIMDDKKLETVEKIKKFLEGSDEVEYQGLSGIDRYRWIELVLRRFKYAKLRRSEKGVIRKYLEKMTGYSRSQVCRLIGRFNNEGELKPKAYIRHRFPGKYTRADMELLAKTDELHGFLSGAATKRILYRECQQFGHKEYENISRISVAHLYNLRKKNARLGLGKKFTKTRRTASQIGERAKPDPQGVPGHIRVDTIHQGDLGRIKGIYHINVVDEVTQWETVISVQNISEAHMIPALTELFGQIPFVIRGFHSDNGSEFVNHPALRLLNSLLIRFTKSRPRHSNDNGLVETKNGWVVRKNLGYSYIPPRHVGELNDYYREVFNLYVNFHRPCLFPVTITDSKGRIRKKYPYQEVMTPYEKLKSLPGAEKCLVPGVTWKELDAIANEMSDNEFAERMVQARFDLFDRIDTRQTDCLKLDS
jgi:transposase InsO family protein